MWPPLLFLDPPSAASALQYRFYRSTAASIKASRCGQPRIGSYCPPTYKNETRALMFPWESAFTGMEVQFGQGGGSGTIGGWGKYEQHISGDISFAARQYFYATQDLEWLKTIGYPLIAGVASFYAARIEPHADGSPGYDFNQVMGPVDKIRKPPSYRPRICSQDTSGAAACLLLSAPADAHLC